MGVWAWILVSLVAAATLFVGYHAARRPILFRMALRNAVRRPRQTATVVLGLMLGSAIISSALVAGDSAGYAIRGAVFEALGHVDETVRIDAFPFFPELVFDELAQDRRLASVTDGLAPNVIWQAAADNQRTDLFEPEVALVGYDPVPDVAFGDFRLVGGGSTDGRGLAAGEAIATVELAEALDLQVGDTINLAYTNPIDPLVPDIFWTNGTVAASAEPFDDPLLAGLVTGTGAVAEHDILVDTNATRITSVLAWNPAPAAGGPAVPSQLRITLTSPDGDRFQTTMPPPGEIELPIWLNVTTEPGTTLAEGTWNLAVTANAGANVDYIGATVVLYPVYDLSQLRSLAGSLEAPRGDDSPLGDLMDRFLPRKEATVTVAAITDGGRGNQFEFGAALFMDLTFLQGLLERPGEINVIKVSNIGGIEAGALETATVMPILETALEGVKARNTGIPAIEAVTINPVKGDFLELAENAGQLTTGLLIFAGSLSIITGLLLIINIFTMLAEERRSDLGMARAVGLTRRDLVRLFVFEGSLYAVAAAAIGSMVGLGLAWLMIVGLNALFADFNPDMAFPAIPFRPSVSAIATAFSAGALITYATIAVASRRQAGLNIVRAIRRIEEPERAGAAWSIYVGIPAIVLGLGAAAIGWTIGQFSMQVFGPLAAILGAGFWLRRHFLRARLFPILSAILFLYYVYTYFVIHDFDNITEANIVGPIRAVFMTLAVVVIAVHAQRTTSFIGRALARLPGMNAVAVLAISYPLHKRFRTGMTLAMFAIVILFVSFFSIFGGLFEVDPDRQTGGFDIEARTTLSVETLDSYDRGLIPAGLITHEERLTNFETRDMDVITVSGERTGQFGPPHHHVFGIDESFVEAQEFTLLWRGDEYATDEAAYQALLERDDVVIVAYQYSTNERNQDLSHEVGDPLQINLGNESLEFTIIGIQEQYHHPGVFLNRPLVESLFPETDNLFLYKIRDGANAIETAKLLERNYREVGMDAESSRDQVLQEQESFRQLLGAMKLFLGLALIVGVLSLGIITSRSVLERRQEIGMLRAIGYQRGQIRRIFLTEVTVTVLAAAAIGIACSIVVTYGLWYAIIRELNYPYVIPWGEIGILLGISYAVTLLATLAPIRRSAKVAPAEALRYIE